MNEETGVYRDGYFGEFPATAAHARRPYRAEDEAEPPPATIPPLWSWHAVPWPVEGEWAVAWKRSDLAG